MSRNQRNVLTPLLLSLLAATALPDSAAGSPPGQRLSTPDVDIESLSAGMHEGPRGLTLSIRYEIEIEDASPWDRFELVMQVTDNGRPVLDGFGRPLEITAPLTRPTEVDDDELEFEDSLTVDVSSQSIRNPDRLRLWATVVRLADERICERKETSIKMERGAVGQRSWVGWQEPPRIKKVIKRTTRQVTKVRQVRVVRKQRIVQPKPVIRRTVIGGTGPRRGR